jgi:hypothetical protein
VDIRQDQRYMAEHDIFPCGDRDESRFCPDFEVPLSGLGMEVIGDPSMPREISCVQILDGCKRRLEGSERTVISDLLELIKSLDPDLILLPYADTWVPRWLRALRLDMLSGMPKIGRWTGGFDVPEQETALSNLKPMNVALLVCISNNCK